MKDEIKKQFNANVEERQVSIHELINSEKEGRLLSVFGASTWCPLLPVTRICYRDTTMNLNLAPGKDFNKKLNNMLVDAMQADSSPWVTPFE